MHLADIRFTKFNGTAEDDDLLTITYDYTNNQLYKLEFITEEMPANTFYMDLNQTMRYISTTFKSLAHDDDPFEHVQISTAIHPSVMVHASLMEDARARWDLEDIVHAALSSNVALGKRRS